MLKRYQLQTTNRPISVFSHWADEGYLLLDPPYQRGDVWGPVRQVNLIRSILLGVPIPSIVINDRFRTSAWTDEHPDRLAVIDGKQRITTILRFLSDSLPVPGDWFGLDSPEIVFSDLSGPAQISFRHSTIGVTEGQLSSLESEQQIFELINFGGVPQGDSDLG